MSKLTDHSVRIHIQRLHTYLANGRRAAIAVSGGVDSMSLAYIAHRTMDKVEIFHAISPAVPDSATMRVKKYANQEGWNLNIITAGEFSDSRYLSNPVTRCYYCKNNLYRSIQQYTDYQIFSGTNIDDLMDYRPGLNAAAKYNVRHPYVESKINKHLIRQISASMSLDDLAVLPASPCLSSRIETGIRIDSSALTKINEVEEYLMRAVNAETARCRIRKNGIVIELDNKTINSLTHEAKSDVINQIKSIFTDRAYNDQIHFEPYKMGSAFLTESK